MNLGQIDAENQKLLESYKDFGFATKTQLINEALRLLQQTLVEEKRKNLLKKAALAYGSSGVVDAWESIDAEDFVL